MNIKNLRNPHIILLISILLCTSYYTAHYAIIQPSLLELMYDPFYKSFIPSILLTYIAILMLIYFADKVMKKNTGWFTKLFLEPKFLLRAIKETIALSFPVVMLALYKISFAKLESAFWEVSGWDRLMIIGFVLYSIPIAIYTLIFYLIIKHKLRILSLKSAIITILVSPLFLLIYYSTLYLELEIIVMFTIWICFLCLIIIDNYYKQHKQITPKKHKFRRPK